MTKTKNTQLNCKNCFYSTTSYHIFAVLPSVVAPHQAWHRYCIFYIFSQSLLFLFIQHCVNTFLFQLNFQKCANRPQNWKNVFSLDIPSYPQSHRASAESSASQPNPCILQPIASCEPAGGNCGVVGWCRPGVRQVIMTDGAHKCGVLSAIDDFVCSFYDTHSGAKEKTNKQRCLS